MLCIIILLTFLFITHTLSLSLSLSLSHPPLMASTEVEQQSPPLKLKTCVLRVSIHCHGCQRKVKKILQSVPGVHDIESEIKLQRVVVTGDVSPEILINKLLKSGKHAELWPEKEKPPEIRVQKTEKITKTEESAVPEKQSKPPVTKPDVPVEDQSKTTDTTVSGGGVPAGNGGGKVNEGVGKNDGEKVAVEVKAVEKKPETGSAGNQASQPVVEKKEEPTEKTGGTNGGEGKKKKKKKAQNNNNNGNGETSTSAPPPVNRGGSPPPTKPPSNQTPPRHQGYQYPPPHYYTPPPAPVYTVSYNTAHPTVNSFTASYYAPPPPPSYAYSHYGSEMEHQQRPPPAPPQYVPADYDSYRQQPSDSFEMFSDENPNGCLVM